MKSSSQAVKEKYQVPSTRRRDHPQFQGMRRTNSSLQNQNLTIDEKNRNFSRSLSSIWELESKARTPDTINTSTVISETPSESIADEKTHEPELKTSHKKYRNYMDLSHISLPQSAASYFSSNRSITEYGAVIKTCASVSRLNEYLRARKADLKAGLPGMFLHAVIGQEVADLGSVVSTILYAYLSNETYESDELCIVPVANMERADLGLHPELKWLLASCQVEESSLVFIDEIDLSYYNLFGNLSLVLVNSQSLPKKLEGLREALVETLVFEECSCCTFVAERFAETSPEILSGQGFSRLLLSGILLDTANLTDAKCTDKDKYMATLLIRGAGRFGMEGLYQILKYKKHSISSLKVRDILRKEFKRWTRVAGKPNRAASRLSVFHIGLCSIGLSVEELLAHEESAAEEIIVFQESEKLRLLVMISGYYDSQKNFKREILVSATTVELMNSLLLFFNVNDAHLQLKKLHLLDSSERLKAFEIDNQLISRRSIESLLEEFGGLLRQHTTH